MSTSIIARISAYTVEWGAESAVTVQQAATPIGGQKP